jgi:hypothetical protein
MSWTKTLALSTALFAGSGLGAYLALAPRPATAQQPVTENILLVPRGGLRLQDETGALVGMMGRNGAGAFLQLNGPNGPGLTLRGGAESSIEASGPGGGVRLVGGAQSGVLVQSGQSQLSLAAGASGTMLSLRSGSRQLTAEASPTSSGVNGQGPGGSFGLGMQPNGAVLELKSAAGLMRATPDKLTLEQAGSQVWSAPGQTSEGIRAKEAKNGLIEAALRTSKTQ